MSIDSRVEKNRNMYAGWHICERIGIGSNGNTSVFRIERRNVDWKEENALKIVNIMEERGVLSEFSEEVASEYRIELDQKKKKALREVQFMHELGKHPNIISYHDFCFLNWQEDGWYGCDLLIRMDFLQCIRDNGKGLIVDHNKAVKLGKDICSALIACGGIAHRDIKPNNIFINGDDFLLGDWGISRVLDDEPYRSTVSYSAAYAAPEQIDKRLPETKLVDIYSLGLTLYEICNRGRLPFAENKKATEIDVARRLEKKEAFPPPCDADEALAAVIMKACAYRPRDRWQSADEMLSALSALESDPYVTRPAEPGKSRGYKTVWVVAAVLALILCVFAASFFGGNTKTDSNAPALPTQFDAFEVDTTTEPLNSGTEWAKEHAASPSTAEAEAVIRSGSTSDVDDASGRQGGQLLNDALPGKAGDTASNTADAPIGDKSAAVEKSEGSAASVKEETTATPQTETSIESVSLGQSTLTINNGGRAALYATVTPTDAVERNVTWASSDPNVVEVDGGMLIAVGDGIAIITATAGGKSASCAVTVKTVWSEWLDGLSSGVATRAETRTVYRYTDHKKEIVSTTSASYGDGYMFDHSEVSVGTRGEWSDAYIAPSDKLEVYTRQVVDVEGHTEYQYGCWVGADGGHSYCNVMAEYYYGAPARKAYTDWSTTRLPNAGTMWTCASPDGGDHKHEGTGGFIAENTGNRVWYLYSSESPARTENGYFWENSRWVDTTYKTQYSSAPKITTNYFYKLVPSYVSDWSTERPVSEDNRTIEEKTQYRYMITG